VDDEVNAADLKEDGTPSAVAKQQKKQQSTLETCAGLFCEGSPPSYEKTADSSADVTESKSRENR
jgi:hypothetical protein